MCHCFKSYALAVDNSALNMVRVCTRVKWRFGIYYTTIYYTTTQLFTAQIFSRSSLPDERSENSSIFVIFYIAYRSVENFIRAYNNMARILAHESL